MATAVDLQSYIAEDTIFITPTGSRLYGLENVESDYDFTVLSAGKKISSSNSQGEIDIRRVDFRTFYTGITEKPGGVFLEALYSQKKILGPRAAEYMPILEELTPAMPQLRSNIYKMGLTVLREERRKRVRFAAYLASRWNQWYWSGAQRYNPTLTPEEKLALEEITERLLPLSKEERRAIFKAELFFLDEDRAREIFQLNLNPQQFAMG